MELLLICGIVAVAAVAFTVHLVRTLRGRKPPCCTCDTCLLPESEREQCATEHTADKNSAGASKRML